MITLTALSLCLAFSNQAGDVMVQRQLGVTEQVLEQLAPARVVEGAFRYPMMEMSLAQERMIDEFRERWLLKCLDEKQEQEEDL